MSMVTKYYKYKVELNTGARSNIRFINPLGQEVSSYWYAAVRQYDFFKESDILHANVNAGIYNINNIKTKL